MSGFTPGETVRRVPLNLVLQAQWLVVKVAKYKSADEPHRGFKKDDTSARARILENSFSAVPGY